MPSARDKAKQHPGYEAAVQGRLCQPGAADVGSARGPLPGRTMPE
jgi:hypothetical protein